MSLKFSDGFIFNIFFANIKETKNLKTPVLWADCLLRRIYQEMKILLFANFLLWNNWYSQKLLLMSNVSCNSKNIFLDVQ